jgi:hypothetical protein
VDAAEADEGAWRAAFLGGRLESGIWIFGAVDIADASRNMVFHKVEFLGG